MIRFLNDSDNLLPLIEKWRQESNHAAFGLAANVQKVADNLKSLPACLVMEREGAVVGFMGISVFISSIGPERIANEHFWYVLPEYRGHVRGFVTVAKKWAREHGCTHLMLNASYMASDRCERVSKFYQMMGFAPFEHTYIGRT